MAADMGQKLSVSRLREAMEFDPAEGVFTRDGVKLGYLNPILGYRFIRIDKGLYLEHRIAWMYVHGEMPSLIDHIDGNKQNNRIANLRDVSRTVNAQNRRAASKNSRSGVLGVCWDRGRWVAHIMVRRKRKNLGRYQTIEEAHAAYLSAKRAMHEGCTI